MSATIKAKFAGLLTAASLEAIERAAERQRERDTVSRVKNKRKPQLPYAQRLLRS